jgi:hypothetical protein
VHGIQLAGYINPSHVACLLGCCALLLAAEILTFQGSYSFHFQGQEFERGQDVYDLI